MEEQITPTPELPERMEVVDIQFRPGQKVYFFDPAGHTLKTGDNVIIDTARGPEFGTCAAGNHTVSSKEIVAPLRPVIRIANGNDLLIAAKNREIEGEAYALCLTKIEELGLDMQLVAAECAFDGTRILLFFTADERVDFRDLVKILASHFHTRIELRQIGVRDKAKMVGGLGICGLPFCCASFLDDFQPVSIKMAKTQNLSLNPTKISGTCGRLMCCLKYEQDAYEDLLRTAPKADSFVDTPEGRGTVIEVDLLRQRVKVKMEEHPEIISVFPNTDIAIFRAGKAKKTDPPIPDDWAPISGNKKAVKEERAEEGSGFVLDSIKFRYSEETIADEIAPEEPPVAAETAPGQKHPNNRRNRNRRHKKPGSAENKNTPTPAHNAGAESISARPANPGKTAEAGTQVAPHAHKNVGAGVPDGPQEGAEKTNKKRRNFHRYHKKPGNSKPAAE